MSAGTHAIRGALEAIERLLNRGGDADDVLRAIVRVVVERLPDLESAVIEFVERDAVVEGPRAGSTSRALAETFPIRFQGLEVARLRVPGPIDGEERAFLERVAVLVSPHCLVGWDTGGVPWPETR